MEEEKGTKKPSYKKWWVWLLAVIIIGTIASCGGEEKATETAPTLEEVKAKIKEQEAEIDKKAAIIEEGRAIVKQGEELLNEDVDGDGTVGTETEEIISQPIKEEPKLSLSQQNAIREAEGYLDYTAFSKSGLIEQLEYEGYPTEEATFAVDQIEVDWNEQAVKSAQSYLEYTSFSRSGLIEQLQYEGFTTEQATYGVDQVGL